MPVKNRSHLVTLMAVLAFVFVTLAAIAPAALAGRSEVYFSDVNGQPKTEWKVGEVLYITVVSHDENRDSDEVEFIDARSRCETHTRVPVPCVEIWNPNTKDSETNYGTLRLAEVGSDTGIFRNPTGILIRPIEEDPAHQENGTLEVFHGDTIAVRYQSPSDDTDIDLDLGKITATPGIIRITDQAGRDVPIWQIGQQIWITVEDPDQNVDPLKPEAIKGITLWGPRCVWDVIERQGDPRSDQPQPKPCDEAIAPLAYDSQLKAAYPGFFEDSLILYETGPNTGVFRNANGITLRDNLGPRREFSNVATALSLFVNHKDTIVAFYRKPAIIGQAVVPPPPPPPPPVQTRTDTCPASPLLECSRTVPVSVTPGQTFQVTFNITARQAMRLIALREQAPTGFRFGTTQATPTPEAISTDGALRAAWNGSISAGETITLTYELTAGATPGSYKIRGFVTGAPFTIIPLVSDITVAASTGQSLRTAQVRAQAENAQLRITRQAPTQANVGTPFTVTLTVTAKQALPAVSVKENFDGLTLVDQGADFIGVEGTTLRGLMIQPAAGATQNYTYRLQCAAEGNFTITGTAESRDVQAVRESSTITCGAGVTPPPPPPTGQIFRRGQASPNDPQDFALAQAKVGHFNPAKLQFTDINGNELTEFAIGTEFFITLIDDDQNMDSDHVETLCVQVFDVNGGREGDTPGIARELQNLLKDDPRACLEDHVRDLFMWKTGVKLVETGMNTGIFRNPDALKIIGICAQPEAENYPFNTDPAQTLNIQIHKLVPSDIPVSQLPGVLKDDPPQWWAEPSVKVGTVLKDCYYSTPYVAEGRTEAPLPYDPTDPGLEEIKTFTEDVPHKIAVNAGDVVYAVFQDQLVDPHDVVYATARVKDFQTFDGRTNNIQWVDENGRPVDTYKIGQDVFVRLRDDDRNVSNNVVDKLEILVLNRNSGDWENLLLEETGADTGVFMNRAGLSLQPALTPGTVRVNNNRLEMFDRDVIEAHYQDNYNAKDFSAAWIRLIPQPMPGPGAPPEERSETMFTDAQGRKVTTYGVGDMVYVTVKDASQNVSSSTEDAILNAITVTNTRTGASYTVDAVETGPNTGVFLSDPIRTGAPGALVDLEVEDGDILEAKYIDPRNPADTSTATVDIVSRVFSCTGARFTSTMTFMAIGTGITQIAVSVFDLSGRLLIQLPASGSQVPWIGTNADGQLLAKGVYLYQLTCSGRMGETTTVPVQKLVLR